MLYLRTPGDEVDETVEGERDDEEGLPILRRLHGHVTHEEYREDEGEEREEYIHLRIRRRLMDPDMPLEIFPEESDAERRDK